MLVQNADDGRLQAVTGVDRDGNIQTADPTDQNVASLLNVNTQDSALEAFFKKFMEQAQNPVHTGIFVMTENALKSKYNGGTRPIGYLIDSDQYFQLDPLTAPFVREAFQRYDEGATMTAIRDWLNDRV